MILSDRRSCILRGSDRDDSVAANTSGYQDLASRKLPLTAAHATCCPRKGFYPPSLCVVCGATGERAPIRSDGPEPVVPRRPLPRGPGWFKSALKSLLGSRHKREAKKL